MAVALRTLKASFMRQAHFDAIAIVAQLVEQRIRNAWVAGSSPASGSKQKTSLVGVFCFTLKSSFQIKKESNYCISRKKVVPLHPNCVLCAHMHET